MVVVVVVIADNEVITLVSYLNLMPQASFWSTDNNRLANVSSVIFVVSICMKDKLHFICIVNNKVTRVNNG